jgi:hypothetical protein
MWFTRKGGFREAGNITIENATYSKVPKGNKHNGGENKKPVHVEGVNGTEIPKISLNYRLYAWQSISGDSS